MREHAGDGTLIFDANLARWGLMPDGDLIVTRSARLLPVRRGSEPAMLRIAVQEDAKGGDILLAWWDGRGAARVLASDGDVLLLRPWISPSPSSPWPRSGASGGSPTVLARLMLKPA
ncbi:MAG: aminoglycoside phosphotransferase family protein [Hyphomicrobium sp.]|uniref:aminoglycoside phosphotransferase family protein n=1 Tax=Hyphomicrobium sp. TaxID=82 RepID=UPI003D11B9D9